MFVLGTLPCVSVVALKTVSLILDIVLDVVVFVEFAVYLYRGSLLSVSLLGGERKMSLVLCVEF